MTPSSRALLACVAVALSPVPALADALLTDRPTVSPASGVVKRGRLQLELGPVLGGPVVPLVTAARYGLLENVELRLSADVANFTVGTVRGPTTVSAGLKVELGGNRQGRVSALAHGNLETSRSRLGLDVGLVGGASLGSGLSGWAFLSARSPTVVPFGPVTVAGAFGLGQGLAMEGRVGAFVELSFAWVPGGAFVPAGTMGFSFNPSDDVQLDAYLMPTFLPVAFAGGFGVSFRL